MRWAKAAASALLVVAAVGVATPAAGLHGPGDGTPCNVTESYPSIRGPLAVFLTPTWVLLGGSTPAGPDDAQAPTAVLVYQDTNGVEGIQRNDAFVKDAHCGHGRDTLVAGGGCAATVGRSPGLATPVDPRMHGCVAEVAPPDQNEPPFDGSGDLALAPAGSSTAR